MKKLLLKIGLIRLKQDGSIRWPIRFAPWHIWRQGPRHWVWYARLNGWFYTFRNVPGIIKWEEGRLLPRRWGFSIGGLVEIGDRG